MKIKKINNNGINGISKKYDLCNHCLSRLESKKTTGSTKKCFICKNIFQHLDDIVNRIFTTVSSYEFSDFDTGVMLKHSLSDRDDLIKSAFKIKGVSSIKTNINHEIAKKISRKIKKKLSHSNADLIVTVNLKDHSYEIYSKPIFIYGRYIKKTRLLAQKQRSCNNCSGKGCHACSFHGLQNFNSVEGKITEFLIKKFDCQQVKFNWLGGEEKSSLVLGNGRPFFVKITNPKRRTTVIRRNNKLDGIELVELRKITELPKGQIFFKSKVLILVRTEKPVKSSIINYLDRLDMPLEIQVRGKKTLVKNIYKINIKKTPSNLLKISIYLDGGIPIKPLIQNTDVVPNFTNLLKTKCECIQFDFKKIDVMS